MELSRRSIKKESFPSDKFCGNKYITQESNEKLNKNITEEFNEYFAQMGETVASACQSNLPLAVEDMDYTLDSVFTMCTVTDFELKRYVEGLRGSSAPV